MQRHFSNRGEALAEVAAAKMMTHRTTMTKSAFPNQRRSGMAPGQWKARLPEAIRSTGAMGITGITDVGRSVDIRDM